MLLPAKKYVGRTAELTISYLEQMARALRCSPEQTHQVLSNADTRGASDARAWQATELAEPLQNGRVSCLPTPLLVSQFHLPPLSPSLLPRERLLAQLDHTLEYRLTLVSAPAGFGKTTLVRQWPGFLWMEAITILCASGVIFSLPARFLATR